MKTQTVFYVVTKALGAAMREGRKCDTKGTVYATFSTEGKAQQFRKDRGLGMVSVVIAL